MSNYKYNKYKNKYLNETFKLMIDKKIIQNGIIDVDEDEDGNVSEYKKEFIYIDGEKIYNLRKVFEDEYEEMNTSGISEKYSSYLTKYVNTYVYKLSLKDKPHFNLYISIRLPRIFYNKKQFFNNNKKIYIHIMFHHENDQWRLLVTMYTGYKRIWISLYNRIIDDTVTIDNVKLKILEIFEKFHYLQSDTDGYHQKIKLYAE
jgi:hypothetical protein